MEKVYVTLLILVAACLIDENVANSSRRAKMGPIWGGSNNGSFRGSGSFAVKGKAGGLSRSGEQSKTAPSTEAAKPTAADCTAAGFYPSPGSCTNFYRCVDWTGAGSFFSIFHFTCPLGTVFDDALDVCNHAAWAGRSECGGTAGSPTSSEKPGGDVTGTDGPSTDKVTKSPEGPTSSVGDTTGDSFSPVTQTTVTPVVTSGQIGEVTQVSVVVDTTTETSPPGVFSLTCYADNKYRRHPLYCNKYYYCIYDGDVWNVPSFTCPEGLVFDGDNQICTRPSEADLSCKKAPTDKPKTSSAAPPLETTAQPTEVTTTVAEVTTTVAEATETPVAATDSPAVAVTKAPVDTTTIKSWEVDPTSLFACPAPGYYPFEGDCIRFYKCVETEELKLKGLLYRCPEGYGYSEERQRCRKQVDLPACQRVPQLMHLSLRYESATPVYPEDFMWFFKN